MSGTHHPCCCKAKYFETGLSLRGYLGLSYIDSQGQVIPITEEEFATFIPVIAAAFPDGFTIYDANGGYYDSVLQKTVVEKSKVLEIVVGKEGVKKSISDFALLMDTYTTKFHQSGQFWTKNNCQFHSS